MISRPGPPAGTQAGPQAGTQAGRKGLTGSDKRGLLFARAVLERRWSLGWCRRQKRERGVEPGMTTLLALPLALPACLQQGLAQRLAVRGSGPVTKQCALLRRRESRKLR